MPFLRICILIDFESSQLPSLEIRAGSEIIVVASLESVLPFFSFFLRCSFHVIAFFSAFATVLFLFPAITMGKGHSDPALLTKFLWFDSPGLGEEYFWC